MREILFSPNVGSDILGTDIFFRETVNVSFSRIFSAVRDVLVTLFLFTKSDFKTILLPVLTFAFALCREPSLGRFAEAGFWTWLHLLQFCVSNQSLSMDEDTANKPWRPVPSGRITPSAASALRWALIIPCLILSHQHNLFGTSLALVALTFVHNEAGLHDHWLTRNICCALGYMLFQWGATSMASPCYSDGTRDVDMSKVPGAILMSGLILVTTIHAQDFKDVIGDRIFMRETMPIVMPRASRIALLVTMTLWSFWLPHFWRVSPFVSDTFCALGLAVGLCCFVFRTVRADQFMYILYNFWLAWALMLPSQSGES